MAIVAIVATSAWRAWLLLASAQQGGEPHAAEWAAIAERMHAGLEPRLVGADLVAAREAVGDAAALRLEEAQPQLVTLVERLAAAPEAATALAVEAFDLARRFEARFDAALLVRLWESPRFRAREVEIGREAFHDRRENDALLRRIVGERRSDAWRDLAWAAAQHGFHFERDGDPSWLMDALLPIARSRIVVRDEPADPASAVDDGIDDEIADRPAPLFATTCLERLAYRRFRGELLSRPQVVAARGLDAPQLEAAVAAARARQAAAWERLREGLAEELIIDREWFRTPRVEERIEVVDERGAARLPESGAAALLDPSRLAAAPLPFPRMAPPSVRDPACQALRARAIDLAREELASDEWRVAAWGAAHAADRGLAELAPEIERLIARAGLALARLPDEVDPTDAAFTDQAPLAAGWAALDAALRADAEIGPEALARWWAFRLQGREAALLLATRAPDRFADALLARSDEHWSEPEWRLWCETLARSRRADLAAHLLDRIEFPVAVVVHAGPDDGWGSHSIGCPFGRPVSIPAGFPPTRQWRITRWRERFDASLPAELVALGAMELRERESELRRDDRFAIVDLWPDDDAFDRCDSLVAALGVDVALVRGARKRDLDFVDAASFRAARDAMELADRERWRRFVAALVAAGRIAPTDAARWPPPFRYDTKIVGAWRSLQRLLEGG